jgi:hypothetical protein
MTDRIDWLDNIIQLCDTKSPEILEIASNALEIDVSFWKHWRIDEVTPEDLQLAEDLVSHLRDLYPSLFQEEKKSNDVASSIKKSPMQILRELKNNDLDQSARLATSIYEELAHLTARYSVHRKTQTVYYRNHRLEIKPEDAFSDGSKDTFEDNGIVSQHYLAIIKAILIFVSENEEDEEICIILSKLYTFISTLSDDACNQQNAIEFGQYLLSFAPNIN